MLFACRREFTSGARLQLTCFEVKEVVGVTSPCAGNYLRDTLGAMTLLGAPGIATRSKDAIRS